MRRKTKLVRSRGAVALLRTGKSQDVIAKTLNTTRGNVASYVSGRWKPRPELRRQISEHYGVDPTWWDQDSGALPLADLPQHHPRTVDQAAADLEDAVEIVQRELVSSANALPGERARILASLSVVLKNAAAARANVTPDFAELRKHILRSEEYEELRSAMREGLRGAPDAVLAKVEEAFERIDDPDPRKNPLRPAVTS